MTLDNKSQEITWKKKGKNYGLGCLVVAALVFGIWRCQFGVELYDEPFYLLPGFKLIHLGDRPLLDEFVNAPRHYDLLNYGLVQPLFSSFSVLHLRWLSFLTYATLIFCLGALSFRKIWGLTPLVLLSACLFFDPYGLWTWSHNSWARNALILHQIALLGILKLPQRRRGLALIAGLSSGLASVAYNPMILVCGSVLAVCMANRFRKAAEGREKLRDSILPYYLLGCLIPLAFDLSYIGQKEVRESLWASVKQMGRMPAYHDNRSFGKFIGLWTPLWGNKDFWLLGTVGFLLTRIPAKKNKPFRDKLLLALGLFLIVYLGRRLYQTEFFFITQSAYLVSGTIACLTLSGFLLRDGEILGLLGVSAGVAMLSFGMASVNGTQSLFWAVPLALIPGFGLLKDLSDAKPKLLSGVLGIFLFLWAFQLSSGSLRKQATETYFDAAPTACPTRLEVPPLTGLYTTQTRARLIEELAAVAKDKPYALSIGVPGIFYFSKLRSSLRSTLAHLTVFTPEMCRSLLSEIPKSKRFPELLVREKTLQWSWGLKPIPIEGDNAHPYNKFITCAADRLLYSDSDLEIFSTNAVRTLSCLPDGGLGHEVVAN
jgi:hypothetical protein